MKRSRIVIEFLSRINTLKLCLNELLILIIFNKIDRKKKTFCQLFESVYLSYSYLVVAGQVSNTNQRDVK